MGIPLDPFYEAAVRQLQDQLMASLSSIQAQRPELKAQNALDMARLATNQGIDIHNLNGSLAGRGIFDSGIRTTDTGQLNTQYDRQRQDAAFALAHGLGGLSNQAAQARLGYTQGLTEAQLESARRAAQDPYAAVAKYRKTPQMPKRKLPNRRPY